MIDPASLTTKKDHSENYWKKQRVKLHLKAAENLCLKFHGHTNLKVLTEKQRNKIIKMAVTKPNVYAKAKK